MINLVFGDSAAGALKYAKSMKHGAKTKGAAAIGFIGSTESELPDMQTPDTWQGLDIEGGAEDVASLDMALDIGDISGGISSRKAVLNMLFSGFSGYEGVADDMWRSNERTLSRLEEAKKTHDKIRIWLCEDDPAELCGLCFVCSLLEGSGAAVSVIRLPRRIEKEGTVTSYRNTGEASAEILGSFAGLETPLSTTEIMWYAMEWKRLVCENSPLRACVNGALMSVPEDFYDFVIRENIPDGEFVCAKLIGKSLITMPGVGDRWLFLRIEKMLDSGELIEVSPTAEDHPYTAVLKREKTQ